MKTRMRQTIGVLIIPLMLGFIAIIACGMIFSMAVSRAQARAYRVATESAAEQIMTLNATLDGRFTTLEAYAESFAYKDTLEFESEETLGMMGAVQDAIYFYNMYIVDAEGNAFCQGYEPFNVVDTTYFQKAMQGKRSIEKRIGRLSEEVRMILAVPIKKEGEVLGVVCGSFDESSFRELLISEAYDRQGYSFVVDSKGNVIIGTEHQSTLLQGDNVLDVMSDFKYPKGFSYGKLESDLSRCQDGYVACSKEDEGRYVVYCYTGVNDWMLFNSIPGSIVQQSAIETAMTSYMALGVFVMIFFSMIAYVYGHERHRQSQLEEEKEDFRIVTDQSERFVLRYDLEKDRLYPIGKAIDLFNHYTVIEHFIEEGRIIKHIMPQSQVVFHDFCEQMKTYRPKGECHLQVIDKAGETKWFQCNYTLVLDGNGHASHSIISFFDNTKNYEKELVYRQRKSEFEVLTLVSTAYLEVNLSRDRIEVGSSYYKGSYHPIVTETIFSKAMLIECRIHVDEDDADAFIEFFDPKRLIALYYANVYEDAIEYQSTIEGSRQWYRTIVHMIKSPDSEEIKAFIMMNNIHYERSEFERLADEASKDALTQLLNRNAMEHRITKILDEASDASTFAMFILDLDNFKQVNDLHGHQVGDQVLREVAHCLMKIFSEKDLVGRIGGDEFMIFWQENGGREHVIDKALRLIEELQFWIDNTLITASVGICLGKGAGGRFEQLYNYADAALYSVKRKNKCGYAIWGSDNQLISDAVDTANTNAIHLQSILENMDGGVIMAKVEEEVTILYTSPSIFRMVGGNSTRAENLMSIVYPDDLMGLNKVLHNVVETGQPQEYVYRIGKEGGVWRHLRAAKLSLRGTSNTLIGVVTDITALKKSEAKLKTAEERYRIGIELSRAIMWEVDIPNRILYSTYGSDKTINLQQQVYIDIPDSIILSGMIHADSREEILTIYADIVQGIEGKQYILRARSTKGGDVWVNLSFRLLYDEQERPIRAVGIAEPCPNIDTYMYSFKQEMRLLGSLDQVILGTACANLTQNIMEASTFPVQVTCNDHQTWDDFHTLFLDNPLSNQAFIEMTQRDHLINEYQRGQNWIISEYRRQNKVGEAKWVGVSINLIRHPVSGDIYGFVYFRDIDARRKWELMLETTIQRDSASTLFTMKTLERLFEVAIQEMDTEKLCAVTVLELVGLDKIKQEQGLQIAKKVLSTFAYICCTMTSGEIATGLLDEGHIIFFRINVPSSEQYDFHLTDQRLRFLDMLEQTVLDVKMDIIFGYVTRSKHLANFQEMTQKALLATQIARRWPEKPVVAYSDMRKVIRSSESVHNASEGVKIPKILLVNTGTDLGQSIQETLGELYQLEVWRIDELSFDENLHFDLGVYLAESDSECILREVSLLREMPSLKDTPIVVLQQDKNELLEAELLQLGISDYIALPYTIQTLLTRIEKAIQIQAMNHITAINQEYEVLLQHQAHQLRLSEFDPITGLYNRKGFYPLARKVLEDQPDGEFVLVRWDIDHFKMINDLFGMEEGDKLLKYMAQCVHRRFPERYLVARLEADHFVMLFDRTQGLAVEELFEGLQELIHTYMINFKLTLHMGVYEINNAPIEVSLMCDRALLALRLVKGSFSKRIGYYNDSLREQMIIEHELSTQMEDALKNGQFEVYFQPQYDYSIQKISGAEALVRWNHPQKGIISPGLFIPLFERNGFINTLDYYIWKQVCVYLAKWQEVMPKGQVVPVSINISRSDIYNVTLCQDLLDLVRQYNVPISLLKLEITESAYMENPQQLVEMVGKFKEAGFSVAMDDFGSGYSSLNTLKDVPVDVLKLDMKFIGPSTDDIRRDNILKSIISMAKILDLEIIVEGVETAKQAQYLYQLGCHQMQGYFFSKPITVEAYEKLMGISE